MSIFENKAVFNRRTSGMVFLSSHIIRFLLKSQNAKEIKLLISLGSVSQVSVMQSNTAFNIYNSKMCST